MIGWEILRKRGRLCGTHANGRGVRSRKGWTLLSQRATGLGHATRSLLWKCTMSHRMQRPGSTKADTVARSPFLPIPPPEFWMRPSQVIAASRGINNVGPRRILHEYLKSFLYFCRSTLITHPGGGGDLWGLLLWRNALPPFTLWFLEECKTALLLILDTSFVLFTDINL